MAAVLTRQALESGIERFWVGPRAGMTSTSTTVRMLAPDCEYGPSRCAPNAHPAEWSVRLSVNEALDGYPALAQDALQLVRTVAGALYGQQGEHVGPRLAAEQLDQMGYIGGSDGREPLVFTVMAHWCCRRAEILTVDVQRTGLVEVGPQAPRVAPAPLIAQRDRPSSAASDRSLHLVGGDFVILPTEPFHSEPLIRGFR
jgi:hypothetical protein